VRGGTGECLQVKGIGVACSGAEECLTGFCPAADFICCEDECTGTCTSCLKSKNGIEDGRCHQLTACTDPDSDCPDVAGVSVCGPQGTCRLSLGCTP
jgi:hypothetical protein